MTDALLAGLLAGYAVALPLGAIGSYLVTLGSQERYAVAASSPSLCSRPRRAGSSR